MLSAQLPALERPHIDLVPETLSRFYDFPDARIRELQRLALAGKRKIVFVADALDETSQEIQSRNLFQSNRLSAWGDNGWPKLIITCRTTHFPTEKSDIQDLFTAEDQDPRVFKIADFKSSFASMFPDLIFSQCLTLRQADSGNDEFNTYQNQSCHTVRKIGLDRIRSLELLKHSFAVMDKHFP